MEPQRMIPRTVEIVAWRFNGETNLELVPEWARSQVLYLSSSSLTLKLPSAEVIVPAGAWLYRDDEGLVGACSHESFTRDYRTLPDDANAVELRMRGQCGHWTEAIVERASIAFHDALATKPGWQPWPEIAEHRRTATRLAMRKALTAAISGEVNHSKA